MDQNNTTGKVLGSLLIGAAVGGALGILFAPKKGSETRRDISDKSAEFTGAIKDRLNNTFTKIGNEAELVREKANKYMGDGVQHSEKA